MSEKNQVLEAIYRRRSVRHFTDEPIPAEDLAAILEAGRWAPSGENNQPWRFVVVEAQGKRDELAALTRFGKIIRTCAVCIAVFLDQASCYDRVKDAQTAGACAQNMLLAAHSLGWGAVWLGEILKNKDDVRDRLGLEVGFELQAVVALGRPKHRDQSSQRRPLEELVVGRF